MALSEQEEFELLSLEREKSNLTSNPAGAAVGAAPMARNPLAGSKSVGERLSTIGGAGALGAIGGAMAPEILTGIASVAGSFPATAPIAPALTGMGNILRGSRGMSAASGAIGGLVGETAGQAVEASGGSSTAAETARFVGGAIGPEPLALAKTAIQKYITTPSLSLLSKIKKEGAIAILNKLDGAPQTLTEQEAKFVREQVDAIRGGAKSDAPLESVGSIMGQRGRDLLDTADQQMITALNQQSQIGKPGAFTAQPNADIGTRLRDVITNRNQAAIDQRAAQFKDTERVRDLNISNREKYGYFIDRSPEYKNLVSYIEGQIKGPNNSPSVKGAYQKILDELNNPNEAGRTSFNAVDQVRRSLGDVFRGRPAEGYAAVDANVAKDLYGRISDVQKRYAGPAQERLLDDYHSATEGMQIFSSKLGKKATALDQYRAGEYATDPSSLPSTYFKTRSSINALKELTGSNKEVNVAALQYADKQLEGKTAPQAREWMSKNAEWLTEVGPTNRLIAKYVDRLEASELSLDNARQFAKLASDDNKILTRQALPAQRAVELINSGDTEIWAKVLPAINQSPQAKTQLVSAVRQVVADKATSKSTIDLFSRNIRPFLESGGIAPKAMLDDIAFRLDKIQKMEIPEPEKLGMAKRILLNSVNSWSASTESRGMHEFMSHPVPEDQPFLQRSNR